MLLARLDGEQQAERMRELSYLANVLMAGATHGGQRFRILDAAEAALAVCNLGLASLPQPSARDAAAEPADRLFRIGIHRLHHELQLPALEACKRERDDARRARLKLLAEDVPALVTDGAPRFVASAAQIAGAQALLHMPGKRQ
jgi:hypothetical protein